MSVIVPVRNEAALLPAALTALATQVDADGSPFDRRRFEVLVLANNCSDASAEVVRGFARDHPGLALFVTEVELRAPLDHVGHARRLLMDAACRRLPPHGVIGSTDGDTVVARDWLASTLHEFDDAAHGPAPDAVGGRILTASHPEIDRETMRCLRLDTAYRLARDKLQCRLDPDPADPWPRHHQHFGASLAVSRQAYEHVGGLPEVRCLEDEALVQALLRHDLRVRHSSRVRVTTSGRLLGRADVGFSWLLNEWSRQHSRADSVLADDAHSLVVQSPARRQLRLAWQRAAAAGTPLPNGRPAAPQVDRAAVEPLAALWGVTADWLAARIAAARCFGALWAEVQECRRRDPPRPQLPVRQAIDELRRLIADQDAGAADVPPLPMVDAARLNRSSR